MCKLFRQPVDINACGPNKKHSLSLSVKEVSICVQQDTLDNLTLLLIVVKYYFTLTCWKDISLCQTRNVLNFPYSKARVLKLVEI